MWYIRSTHTFNNFSKVSSYMLFICNYQRLPSEIIKNYQNAVAPLLTDWIMHYCNFSSLNFEDQKFSYDILNQESIVDRFCVNNDNNYCNSLWIINCFRFVSSVIALRFHLSMRVHSWLIIAQEILIPGICSWKTRAEGECF